ncbi:fasciclin domain-containing protein [Mucilaginibacter sp. UYCu711]|uniref:fasciclin domain-containing protein n=1 Tax=Mucilaginibacter sp. UYCu711 TaxID=3156339 RepID=UPI003D245F8A
MMRKTICLIGLLLFNYVLLAQNNTTQKTDSLNKSTFKNTDSFKMLSKNDIVTNISGDTEYSTFNRLIQITGLNETFKSKGPITVFAPNNQAFANLSKGKLDTLLMEERKYDLIALVTYHALAGIVKAKDIAHAISVGKGTASFITITGSKLVAKFDTNHNIILVDENGVQSIVSKFDVKQENGLIHLINGVLIPQFKNI